MPRRLSCFFEQQTVLALIKNSCDIRARALEAKLQFCRGWAASLSRRTAAGNTASRNRHGRACYSLQLHKVGLKFPDECTNILHCWRGCIHFYDSHRASFEKKRDSPSWRFDVHFPCDQFLSQWGKHRSVGPVGGSFGTILQRAMPLLPSANQVIVLTVLRVKVSPRKCGVIPSFERYRAFCVCVRSNASGVFSLLSNVVSFSSSLTSTQSL